MAKKLTRENLTAHELMVYRDYIKFGWLPYDLRDADGMLTELNWIEAMLDREEEGDAIFAQFCKDYEELKKENEKRKEEISYERFKKILDETEEMFMAALKKENE